MLRDTALRLNVFGGFFSTIERASRLVRVTCGLPTYLVLYGVFMAAIGVVAHLQSINQRLLEEARYLERSRRLDTSMMLPTGGSAIADGPR